MANSKRVGFGLRFTAYMADLFIATIIAFFIGALISIVVVQDKIIEGGFVFAYLFNFVVFGVYCIILEGIYGQTLGKKLLSLKVVKENGERIGYLDAFIRRISLLLPILNLIDPLFIFRKNKQRLFDQFANTIVIKHDNQKI